MEDIKEEKAQLIAELDRMRQRVSELEALTTQDNHNDAELGNLPTPECLRCQVTEKLRQVGNVLHSSLNFATVLDNMMEQIGQFVAYDAACILLTNGNTARIFRWRGYAWFETQDMLSSISFSIDDVPTLRDGKNSQHPVIISEVESDEFWVHKLGDRWIKSHISVPIVVRHQVIGFLNVDSHQSGYYTQADANRLLLFVNQASTSLKNAQVYDQARRETAQRLETLKTERNFASAVLNTAGALVMVLNPRGRILRFNRACEQITGYTFDEVRGKGFWDIFLPSYELSRIKSSFDSLLIKKTSNDYECDWLLKDGRKRVIAWANKVLSDDHGQVDYVVCTGTDVTERRQLEDRLDAIHQLGRELNLLHDETAICKIALDTASFLLQIRSSGYGVVNQTTNTLTYRYYPKRGVPHYLELNLPIDTDKRIQLLKSQVDWEYGALENTQPSLALLLKNPNPSWLTAPMIVRDRTIGVIDVESQPPHHFNTDDRRLLQTLADQTAVALENARLYRETHQRVDELTTLTMISQAITSSLDLKDTLTVITDHTIRLLDATAASVVLSDETRGDMWFQAASGGVPESVRGKRLPAGKGIVGWVIQRGESALVADVTKDERFFAHFDEETGFRTRSIICVPLQSGAKTTGAIEVMNKVSGPFNSEDLRLLTWLATPASIAIQNAQLFQEVQAKNDQLHSLSRRLVEVQETERRHIARELHDEAGQALTSLMVGLRLLEGDKESPDAVATRAAELRTVTNDISENLHRLAVNLRPASLDYLGLVAALRQYIEGFSRQYGIEMHLDAVGFDEKRLSPSIETNLYRIVQEALTNVAKHAQAGRVDIFVEQRNSKVVIIVEDNGVGFDPEETKHQGRLGILGIRERTEMLKGSLIVESTIGTGTTIQVEVPYEY